MRGWRRPLSSLMCSGEGELYSGVVELGRQRADLSLNFLHEREGASEWECWCVSRGHPFFCSQHVPRSQQDEENVEEEMSL